MKNRPLDLVKWLILGTLLLAGCASSGNGTSLFLLDNDYADRGEQRTDAGQRLLVIEPVSVAPYLDAGGVVYQTAPHRVVVANSNRWASPLPAQLTEALYAALAGELEHVNVVDPGERRPGRALRLMTRVDEFMGHFDGTAHIAGQWTLVDGQGNRLARQPFEQRVPLTGDGYAALVASLSRGWRETGETIAPAIERALGQSQPQAQAAQSVR